jgi:hypothetical protein
MFFKELTDLAAVRAEIEHIRGYDVSVVLRDWTGRRTMR